MRANSNPDQTGILSKTSNNSPLTRTVQIEKEQNAMLRPQLSDLADND